MKDSEKIKRVLIKWSIAVVGYCATYLIFGNIGILFGTVLAFMVLTV